MVQRQPSGRVRNEPTNDRRIPLSSCGWLVVADHSDRFRRRRAVRATWTARTLAHRFDDGHRCRGDGWLAGWPARTPSRGRLRAAGHLHGLERHTGERHADAGLASEPGPAGDIGSGNSVRRRDLPRARSRMGPGHRTLCLDAGCLGFGDRAGSHQRRRRAARCAGPKHPDLHPGGPDARHAHPCRWQIERAWAGSDHGHQHHDRSSRYSRRKRFRGCPADISTGSGRFLAGGDDCQRHPPCHRPGSRSHSRHR